MKSCDICGKPDCCGGCEPACFSGEVDIQVDPYDSSYWWVNLNGIPSKVKIPNNEIDTVLSTNYSGAYLNYKAEKHTDKVTGAQLGSLIKLSDLRDVDSDHPDSCSILMWNPHCDYCADGCTKVGASWEPYHIPDAGNCVMESDSNGYYHVLRKTDCGCITECKIPVVPSGAASLNYVRDSVPDDPDFPWYYGSYNDKINLHLKENAPEYFGKFALKVTVNYGVQALKSDKMPENYHFTSRLVPTVEGDTIRMTTNASILDGYAMTSGTPAIPWGTMSLRGSIVVIVPKGKEAYLYHEYRVRYNSSFPNYAPCPKNGQKVPDNEASLNSALYPASRLNALQVLIEPIQGYTDYSPVKDDDRSQLDAPNDVYPVLEG